MIRLTTPQHIFTFPQDPAQYEKILVTMWQDGDIVLEKTEADMEFDSESRKAWYKLTQEETRLFVPNKDVKLQIRVLTAEGDAFASDIMPVKVHDVLNDSILEGEPE